MLTNPVVGKCKIQTTVMASTGARAALVVCDKDGVWDEAGIVVSAAGSTGEVLAYTATNGCSGARLYVTRVGTPPSVGDLARFDDLLITTNDYGYSMASISAYWRDRFEKLVLKYKPLRTWAAVLIDWIEPPAVPGPFREDDA
jgi:hypothetical protein